MVRIHQESEDDLTTQLHTIEINSKKNNTSSNILIKIQKFVHVDGGKYIRFQSFHLRI